MTDVIAPQAEQRRRRQQMRAVARRPMTAEEFLYAYAGVEGRWELVDGEPRMMVGGRRRHQQVAGNIYFAMRNEMRSAQCQPFGSDKSVYVDIYRICQPDISVLCDPRDDNDDLTAARHPTVLFEVFPASTEAADRGFQLQEYRTLPSVQAIVHVDPLTETVKLYECIDPTALRETVLPRVVTVRLVTIGVELTAGNMFRRDYTIQFILDATHFGYPYLRPFLDQTALLGDISILAMQPLNRFARITRSLNHMRQLVSL